MKYISTFSLPLFIVFFCLLASQCRSQGKVADKDIETLKSMEYEWLQAEFRLDTAAISKMMDEKFISVGLTGVSTKQEELNGIYQSMSERVMNNHVVDSLYFDDVHIQIFENIAVVTFTSVTKGKIEKVPFENRRTRMYDVWLKRNGQWKAISSQVTPLK